MSLFFKKLAKPNSGPILGPSGKITPEQDFSQKIAFYHFLSLMKT